MARSQMDKSPWTIITIKRLDKTRSLTVHDAFFSTTVKPECNLGSDIARMIKEMTDG